MRHPLTGYLGAGVEWSGDLTFEGRIRIDGTFRGRIYGEDVLEVGPSGLVDGKIDVAVAIIAGTLKGSLRVREKLVIENSGLVTGTAIVKDLEVKGGGQCKARVEYIRDQAPPPVHG